MFAAYKTFRILSANHAAEVRPNHANHLNFIEAFFFGTIGVVLLFHSLYFSYGNTCLVEEGWGAFLEYMRARMGNPKEITRPWRCLVAYASG